MLTEPAASPPSATTRAWFSVGPVVWLALIAAFSLLLLILAAAGEPDASIQYTSLGAAIALTAAFAFRLKSPSMRDPRGLFAATGVAFSAAFEIAVVWRRANDAPWPPPAWLAGALLIAALTWLASSAASVRGADLPAALSEALLPGSMLAFAALYAAPDFTFRSIGSHSGVWIAAGAAIACWFGASAMAPSTLPLALSTFGGSGVLLGLVSGNQTAVALGNVAFIASGLTIVAGYWRASSTLLPDVHGERVEEVLPPLLVALVFAALVLHTASNPHREAALRVAAGSALALLVIRQLVMLGRRRAAVETAERERAEYARRASIDALTGLPNRPALIERLVEELERARRYEQPVSVCYVDADFFKAINDEHGHAAGDDALRVIAASLRQTLRVFDVVGRYGGEEFLVIAPGTHLGDAVKLGERLRVAIEDQVIRLPSGAEISSTISIGVAEYPTNATELEALIDRADIALYEAKQTGRNRVVASSATASA
jgi:diguanylate cyclase (GGDEF)-like protein